MHCVENFRGPKDQEDAQLVRRIEPNSTIGPTLSVRAFELDSPCGLDMLVPRTEGSFIIDCVGHRLFRHAAP